MGGDRAPDEVVAGAVIASQEYGLPISLIGRQSLLEPLLARTNVQAGHITIIDAPDVVTMEEHAVAAVRRKARASITVACEEVAEGRASAVVSAGNSGAVVASAIFAIGRKDGVERPGIAIPFPSISGKPVYVIDAGAVVDPRPVHLLQFARLIRDYLRTSRGIEQPRIGLLSNGSEPSKGNALVREAHELLAKELDLNFYGNIEANAIPDGDVDAVVCDGYSGNVLLKAAEGTASLVQLALRAELSAHWYTKVLAAGLRPAFRRALKSLDYREYGGAPLLGVRRPVIIAHGRSDRHAIANAILAAERSLRDGS